MHLFIRVCLYSCVLSLLLGALESDGGVVEFGDSSCGAVLDGGSCAGLCGGCCATATVAAASAVNSNAVDSLLTVMLL